MLKADCLKKPSPGERLLRLIYPAKCVFCGAILPDGAQLMACDACYKVLPRYRRGFCQISSVPYVNGVFAAFIYENEMEQAIHIMKFQNQPRVAETLSCLLFEEMAHEMNMPDFDMIIPVPMHKRKQRQRGYNQSELLATGLGNLLDVKVEKWIRKTRNTRAQSLLGREERLRNLEDAFALADNADIKGRNILLLDDVTTTGATLNACAKILYEAGASWIFASVIAIAGK